MGKIWLLVLSAAAGFVAAVAGTPDDAERSAYDRGYADATRAVHAEAVRNGAATWVLDEESGVASQFQWSPRHSRSHGGHELSSHPFRGESAKPSDRRRKSDGKSEREKEAEAG